MGLLGRLFGRKDGSAATPAAQTPENEAGGIAPQLEFALARLQAEDFVAAIDAALVHVESLEPGTRADAHRLCALSLSSLDRYPEAFPHWLALFQEESTAHNALQLATTSVMCGELDRGEAWLQKFDEINEASHETSSALARTNFISAISKAGQDVQHALPHLEWLKQLYAHLHITDPTFLYMRGVPFFSAFLENSLPILQATLSPSDVRAWYGELDERLDAEGQASLQQWVATLA